MGYVFKLVKTNNEIWNSIDLRHQRFVHFL